MRWEDILRSVREMCADFLDYGTISSSSSGAEVVNDEIRTKVEEITQPLLEMAEGIEQGSFRVALISESDWGDLDSAIADAKAKAEFDQLSYDYSPRDDYGMPDFAPLEDAAETLLGVLKEFIISIDA